LGPIVDANGGDLDPGWRRATSGPRLVDLAQDRKSARRTFSRNVACSVAPDDVSVTLELACPGRGACIHSWRNSFMGDPNAHSIRVRECA